MAHAFRGRAASDGGAIVTPQNEAATSLQSACWRAPAEKWLPEGSENARARLLKEGLPQIKRVSWVNK